MQTALLNYAFRVLMGRWRYFMALRLMEVVIERITLMTNKIMLLSPHRPTTINLVWLLLNCQHVNDGSAGSDL